MQVEADAVLHAQHAQLDRQRDQVVVVDPDDVVGPQHRLQQRGEAPVHTDVLLEIARFELRKVEAVVEHGPQHGIGVAQIVPVVLGLGERHGDDASVPRENIRFLGGLDVAVPAEPQGRTRAHDIGQRHGNAASLGCLAQVQHAI